MLWSNFSSILLLFFLVTPKEVTCNSSKFSEIFPRKETLLKDIYNVGSVQYEAANGAFSSAMNSFMSSMEYYKTKNSLLVNDTYVKTKKMIQNNFSKLNNYVTTAVDHCTLYASEYICNMKKFLAPYTTPVEEKFNLAVTTISDFTTTATYKILNVTSGLLFYGVSDKKMEGYAIIAPNTILSAYYFNMNVTEIVKRHTANGTFTLPLTSKDCNSLFGNPRKGDYKPIIVVWVASDGCIKSQAFMQDVVDQQRSFVLW